MSIYRLKDTQRDVHIPQTWRYENETFNDAGNTDVVSPADSLVITAPAFTIRENSYIKIVQSVSVTGISNSGGWIRGWSYATRVGAGFPVMSDYGYVKLWDVTGSDGNYDTVERTVVEYVAGPAALTYSLRFSAASGTIRVIQFRACLQIDVARY